MSEAQLQTIQSKIFGTFQVDVGSVYQFQHGIPGLESVKEFALMTIEEYAPIVWMVSINGIFHFPLVLVNAVDEADLDSDSKKQFKNMLDKYLAKNQNEIAYVILKLDQSVTQLSLKAPILINPKLKSGHQLILDF